MKAARNECCKIQKNSPQFPPNSKMLLIHFKAAKDFVCHQGLHVSANHRFVRDSERLCFFVSCLALKCILLLHYAFFVTVRERGTLAIVTTRTRTSHKKGENR